MLPLLSDGMFQCDLLTGHNRRTSTLPCWSHDASATESQSTARTAAVGNLKAAMFGMCSSVRGRVLTLWQASVGSEESTDYSETTREYFLSGCDEGYKGGQPLPGWPLGRHAAGNGEVLFSADTGRASGSTSAMRCALTVLKSCSLPLSTPHQTPCQILS